jgi:hypothetical protein
LGGFSLDHGEAGAQYPSPGNFTDHLENGIIGVNAIFASYK